MKSFLKIYGVTVAISLTGCLAIGLGLGLSAAITVLILSVLEISLSFDNAVVNAKVLKNMSPFWQRMFLTIGLLIAVLGVRLVLPILLVVVFAGESFAHIWQLIWHDPAGYGAVLEHIHPEIAAFGGVFLLMLFLDYILRDREIQWLQRLEKRLIKVGHIQRVEVLITILAFLAATAFVTHDIQGSVLIAGLAGLIIYLAIQALGTHFEKQGLASQAARAGAAGFVYLEVLDASFSLDGVLGAFAITSSIAVILVGLGIGALWVRSMTIQLVRTDTLARYRYLEHGAHYAIGMLALILLLSMNYEISEFITGLVGLIIIVAAFADSVRFNRRARA